VERKWTLTELVEDITQAIAVMEGYYRPGTIARRLRNPGNVRAWRDARGVPYPTQRGYVDFLEWARSLGLSESDAEREGWRVLRTLVRQYVTGRYTGGRSPTLLEMMSSYAPAADGNRPAEYASFISRRTGIPVDVPLATLAS
jgi:hypothetical protein